MDQNFEPTAEPQPAQVPPLVDKPMLTESEARQWAMFCHLAGLAMFVVPTAGQIIGPLVVWLLKKDQHPFVDQQGKEALNFQISMTIYSAVCAALICVMIGIVLLPIVVLADVILLVMASIKVSAGEPYRYPLTIRFLN